MTEFFHFANFILKKDTSAPTKRKILLSIGGRSATCDFLKGILPLFDRLYAVDRGLDIFCEGGVTPDFFVGDMDSASPSSLDFLAENEIETVKLEREKDDTDFQLCLKLAAQKEAEGCDVAVINALGGRLDHLLSNIFTFSNVAPPLFPFFMGDDRELLFFVRGNETLTLDFATLPRNISLLSLADKTEGVTLTGAKWGLTNATLQAGKPYAISNELQGKTVTVTCTSGLLAFYILFSEEDKLNG